MHVLENDAVRLGAVTVIGIADDFSGHADVAVSQAAAQAIGGWLIVLTHTPEAAARLLNTIPLVMAGHIHCGQIHFLGLETRPGPHRRQARARQVGEI